MKFQGWVEEIRNIGSIKFIKLHTLEEDLQITLKKTDTDQKLFDSIDKITRQSAIVVEGELKKNKEAPNGKEIIPKKIEIVGLSETPLPLDPSGKTPAELETRLNWRPLDLRNNKNLAIFKIQSKIVEGFNKYLRKNGFVQVFTPSLLGGTSEGGSEVFSVPYFDKQAYLRQDPQLHRELLMLGGFDKVFDIGPSWRAELSHTIRHLCEHRGIAVEMAFIKDELDIERLEEEAVVYVLKMVKEDCEKDLMILDKEITIPKTPFPELKFPKVYDILKEFGKKIPFGEDYDRESEEILGKYIKEKYKNDFFFVNRFPFAVKPFYVMRVDDEPKWARSIDLVYKGMEQSSGGQREHRYEKLVQQLKEKEMNVENMKWFIDHFKYGSATLGGFCLGLERFTMQMLDIKNIREATLFPRTPERLLP